MDAIVGHNPLFKPFDLNYGLKKMPVILDLFCGGGGAAKGYHLAGFRVVGVDNKPQPHYPFEFIQADAMTFPLEGFDAIHASPPCQRYSVICKGMGISESHPDLVPRTRSRLENAGVPWVMENVEGAPMRYPLLLCGSMFGLQTASGLWLRRHRLFEMSEFLLGPACRHPRGMSIGVYGNGTNSWHREKLGRNITTEEQREAMGIDWMPRKWLSQAIPPAYTEWIGVRLMRVLTQRVVA